MGRRGPDCQQHPSVTKSTLPCEHTLVRLGVSKYYWPWMLWKVSVPAKQKRAADVAAIQFVKERTQGYTAKQILDLHAYCCGPDSPKSWDLATHMSIDTQFDSILVRLYNPSPNPARRLAYIVACYAMYIEQKKMEQEQEEEAAEAALEAKELENEYVPGAEEMSGEPCVIS